MLQSGGVIIRRLDTGELSERIGEFVALSQDAVENGAALGWERPLDAGVALPYWESRKAGIAAGDCVLFGAFYENALCGTVQLERGHFPMSKHRGEIAKLMVRSDMRRLGIALQLMRELESHAQRCGVDLLVLDTRPGEPVEHLYRKTGYRCTGFIPGWLKSSQGVRRDTVFYYKTLDG